jgi:hypothetical protein
LIGLLTYHVQILKMSGDNDRLKQSRRKQGPTSESWILPSKMLWGRRASSAALQRPSTRHTRQLDLGKVLKTGQRTAEAFAKRKLRPSVPISNSKLSGWAKSS